MAKYDKERYTNSNSHWNAERRSERDGFGSKTRVWDKRTGRRYSLDQKGLSIVQRNEAREARSKAFIAILFIVLFGIFSTTYSNLPQPVNVNDTFTSQTYIQEISPEVGQASISALTTFFGIAEGLARTVEFLVTGFGSIVDSVLNFINLDDVINDCVDFNSLSFLQQLNYDATYTFWRIFNPNTPELVYQTQWATNQGFSGVCQ